MFRPALWNKNNNTCEVARYEDPFDFMDRMFGDFFNDFGGPLSAQGLRTDVIDQGDTYKLEADLPGFNKEDIKIDLKDGMLTIKAEHKDSKDEKGEHGRYIRRERSQMSYSRAFRVEGIEPEDILAQYKNGVLAVTIPKKEAIPEKEEAKHIEVQG
ncbi:MAG: Hsp20/alpha crystallin family protein [Lachnospiraceae bacterium]|jgi:HSP20 family molecular chaperone IbpA|nr:Hsp20/alpha crystallin family protein [Lachnospiraceae bacterium]